MRLVWVSCFAALLAGCGLADDVVLEETYVTRGIWELNGPLNEHRSVADLVTALVIEETVGLLGVPGPLEDDAEEVLYYAFGDALHARVAAETPPELLPGSPLMEVLGTTLAQVEIETQIEIESRAWDWRATERVNALRVSHGGRSFEVPLVVATEGGDLAIEAKWQTDRIDQRTLAIAEHEFAVTYGDLAWWIAEEVLEASVEDIDLEIRDAVDCAFIVPLMTGGTGSLEVEIGGKAYRVDAPALTVSCAGVRDVAAVLGLGKCVLALLEMSGQIDLLDLNGDGRAEHYRTKPGYGGPILVSPLPAAIAPQVYAQSMAHAR